MADRGRRPAAKACGIALSLVDADDQSRLEGGRVEVRSGSAAICALPIVVRGADGRTAESWEVTAAECPQLRPGHYLLVETSEPHGTDRETGRATEYYRCNPVQVDVPPGEVPEVPLPHRRCPGPGGDADDELRDAGGLRRRTAGGIWLASMAAVILIDVLAVLPFLWLTALGIASLPVHGLGLPWAAGNLADYLAGGWILNGWGAVASMQTAMSCSPLLWAATLPLAAIIGIAAADAADAACSRMSRPVNPVLDTLPEPMEGNEFGSARLERDPDVISADLETMPADAGMGVRYGDESPDAPEYAGPIFGYVDRPLCDAAAALAAQTAARAVERGLRASDRIGAAEHGCCPRRSQTSFVYDSSDTNTLVIGPTRSGKTRRLLLPTIDLLLRAKNESMIILDPKGELYGLTSQTAIERCGAANVHRIDFRMPQLSDGWNPMENLNRAGRREKAGWDELNSAAQDLVQMIAPPELDPPQAQFFNNGARSYMKSAMIMVATSAGPYRTPCPDDQRSVATVSRLIDNWGAEMPIDPKKPNDRIVPYQWLLERFPPEHPAVEAWSAARAAVAKERSQFVSTALGMLQDFRDSNIAAMTSATDTPLAEAGFAKSVTYLIIPAEKPSYNAFANLFLQQAYQELATAASKLGGRLPVRVNIIGEEFGQVPAIPELAHKMNTSLGLGIRWVLVLQGISQLTETYGRDSAPNIIDACGNRILLRTNSADDTGKWFSEQLGSYTIEVGSSSRSGKILSPAPSSSSQSVSLRERPVLTPDEVNRWRADYGSLCIVHNKGNYVVPLPDISQTPSNAALGLGDEDWNRRKTALAMGRPTNRKPIAQAWGPELPELDKGTYSTGRVRLNRKILLNWLVSVRKAVQSGNNVSAAGKPQLLPPGGDCMGWVDKRDGIKYGPVKIGDPGWKEMENNHSDRKRYRRVDGSDSKAVENTMDQIVASMKRNMGTAGSQHAPTEKEKGGRSKKADLTDRFAPGRPVRGASDR